MFQNPRVTSFQHSRNRILVVCLLLATVTLAVYWPARHYDFIGYDDPDYVFDNQMVRDGLTLHGIQWSLIDRQADNWHPLTWLSHMADCQLFGVNPSAHHIVNVAFHCANAVLLFLLLNTMTAAFWRSAFVAALFALHPLRVESVAWISERKDVLSGFFFLLTLRAYALYAKGKNPAQSAETKSRGIFCKLSLPFFLLGLLSKPTLVTTPLVMLLLDFWPLQRFKHSTFQRLLFEKWPFFLLSIVFAIITLIAQQPALPSPHAGFFLRAENVVANYYGYIEKLFWPHSLSFLYLRPETIPFHLLLQAATVLFFISALAVVARRRCPAFAIGWLWFLIVLLPMSGIVPLGHLSIADRYTYLSGIGIYLMTTWAIVDFTKTFLPELSRKIIFGIAAAIILAVCAILSRQQLAYWQNTETLMEHALKVDPNNGIARVNLDAWRFAQEHPEKKKQLRIP